MLQELRKSIFLHSAQHNILLNFITHGHRHQKHLENTLQTNGLLQLKVEGVLNTTPSTLRLLPSVFLTRQSHLLEEIKLSFYDMYEL